MPCLRTIDIEKYIQVRTSWHNTILIYVWPMINYGRFWRCHLQNQCVTLFQWCCCFCCCRSVFFFVICQSVNQSQITFHFPALKCFYHWVLRSDTHSINRRPTDQPLYRPAVCLKHHGVLLSLPWLVNKKYKWMFNQSRKNNYILMPPKVSLIARNTQALTTLSQIWSHETKKTKKKYMKNEKVY